MKFEYHFDKERLVLNIDENVYYPEDDSLMFADFLLKYIKKQKTMLEIGCGSGFLSILAAKMGLKVDSVDINETALNNTRKNAEENNVSLNVYKSDLFSNVNKKFDLIVFNPPYLKESDVDIYLSEEEKNTLANIDTVKRFLNNAKKYLNKKGKILVLLSDLSGIKLNGKIVKEQKLDWEKLFIFELGD